MSELPAILREIVEACAELPGHLYREEGLAIAILGTLSMPVIVPVGALFYFSIAKEYRDALDEWERLTA